LVLTLEQLRDNAPRPLEVEELGEVIMVRDLTDGERDDIAAEIEKERRSKIAELYKDFKAKGITDREILTDEIDSINNWAMAEQTRRAVALMVVEPDLSSPDVRKQIPRRKLDAIYMAVLREIEREMQTYPEMKEEAKKF